MKMIKNKFFIAFILLGFLMGFTTQDRNIFSFDIIKDFKNISFKDISFNDSSNLYENMNLISELGDTLKIEKIEVKLSNDVELYHSCFNYLTYSELQNDCEYIKYYDTIICINKLLKNNVNKYKLDKVRVVFNKSIFKFKFKDKDYILLGASDRAFFRNIERNYWILLEVQSKNIRNIYSFIDGYYENPKCFGDFNNDGKLDYLNWSFNKNKIELYSLNTNEFLVSKREYIYVIPTIEEKNRMKKGELVTFSILNKKKSKWSNYNNLKK